MLPIAVPAERIDGMDVRINLLGKLTPIACWARARRDGGSLNSPRDTSLIAVVIRTSLMSKCNLSIIQLNYND